MCGRFSLGASATTLAAHFGLFEAPAWSPRYNIAPSQEVLTILRTPDRPELHVALRRWGLIPLWAEGPAVGSRMINARAETVASKPAFRRAFKERRCLVLADGFYECNGGPGQDEQVRLASPPPCRDKPAWMHRTRSTT